MRENAESAIGRIAIDRSAAMPVYRQIYWRVREAILEGRLGAGARLPSARSLASQLATARGTIDAAYALLASEGYVLGSGAAGTRVAALPAFPASGVRRPVARRAPALERGSPPPFHNGLPALDAFPRKLWSRLSGRLARAAGVATMTYQDHAGSRALREAICGYLALSRGVAAAPEQVFVTSGFQGALGLVARLKLRAGAAVWFEDPGYFRSRQALALAGARLIPLAVDEEGLVVAAGMSIAPDAPLAVVTPAHQSPLGVTLSLPRRLALLAWAERAGAWVLEDDYDSEFRYEGRPLPALASLDHTSRVLYAGTFSKVLFPGLQLGYLVVPESEVEVFAAAASLLQPAPSVLPQSIVAAFIAEGHFARHIKRMRALYGERRAALAAALRTVLGDRATIEVPPGGLHLLLRLGDDADDMALAARAERAGLAPAPLSAAAIVHRQRKGLLLSFTNIPAERAAAEAERLRAALWG